jgi:hypothetical protein
LRAPEECTSRPISACVAEIKAFITDLLELRRRRQNIINGDTHGFFVVLRLPSTGASAFANAHALG